MVTNEQRLRALDIALPQPPQPLGAYVAAVESSGLLFVSGMLPLVDGKPTVKGRIGKAVGVEAGKDAARTAALNALAVARGQLGSLNRIKRVVRTTNYIVATGNVHQPSIADGASEILRDALGPAGQGARLVMGVARLPLDAPVMLETIFEVEP